MISTYPKIRGEHERRVNRTSAVACAWVSAVPSIFGFFLMPLPIVVAGRYFSRRLRPRRWMRFGSSSRNMRRPKNQVPPSSYPVID